MTLLPVLVAATHLVVSPALLRVAVGERAMAQAKHMDPTWPPEQRDCAGLVRDVYRAAYRKLDPTRVEEGLWFDGTGHRAPFADARVLLSESFSLLGRDAATAGNLQTGDLVAFEQEPGEDGEPVFHLMLIVRTKSPAAGETLVVYHPGSPGAAVRWGTLADLLKAPVEWRPEPQNRAFLGFYRFKEWLHE